MNRIKKEYEAPRAEVEVFSIRNCIFTTSSIDDHDYEDEF